MTSQDADVMVALVINAGGKMRPAASEEAIAHAEERLGVRFPPSFRMFLAHSNGFGLGFSDVNGVPKIGVLYPHDEMFNSTEGYRENTRLYAQLDEDTSALDQAACIHQDGGGGPHFLLCGQAGEDGEWPVGSVDHETDAIFAIYAIFASCFERFVWFVVRAEQHYAENDDDGPWLCDTAWMTEHDPELARWRCAGLRLGLNTSTCSDS